MQLWGAEANGVFCLWRRPGLEINGLVGFRYLDLSENLALAADTQVINRSIANSYHDSFNTRNQFYGGQLGVRGSWQTGRLFADLTAKVGLGGTHEVIDIQGTSVQTGANAFLPAGIHPGGIFAQTTNIGRHTNNDFSVVPAVEFKVGYQITQNWRAFVGYDFLYWTQVARPGSQADHNINISQNMVLNNAPTTLVGPAQPAVLFGRTDFWAQGVTFGLEFRY